LRNDDVTCANEVLVCIGGTTHAPLQDPVVVVDFSRFHTEQGFDYLGLHDGTDVTEEGLIGYYSGSRLIEGPGHRVTKGSELLVTFHSDATGNGGEVRQYRDRRERRERRENWATMSVYIDYRRLHMLTTCDPQGYEGFNMEYKFMCESDIVKQPSGGCKQPFPFASDHTHPSLISYRSVSLTDSCLQSARP
jgi:hypothetical protein